MLSGILNRSVFGISHAISRLDLIAVVPRYFLTDQSVTGTPLRILGTRMMTNFNLVVDNRDVLHNKKIIINDAIRKL